MLAMLTRAEAAASGLQPEQPMQSLGIQSLGLGAFSAGGASDISRWRQPPEMFMKNSAPAGALEIR